tara:strand:- start:6066 stop:6455 length:390 start_codon:yes stop_codon:yes gene_type:complete
MSCTSNSPNINKTFIIEPYDGSDAEVFSACTGFYTDLIENCTGDSIKLNSNVVLFGNMEPENDNSSDLGSSNKRFREINSFKGTSTIWEATQEVTTPNLNLGVDYKGNNRIINANNSILKDDVLLGGSY